MNWEKNEKEKAFVIALESWFGASARDFPWRHTTDPYQIWISEIMLQQTQAGRVAASYFPRFISKFPNLETLAKASWEDVFPLWDGLGFYRRGKNLLKTAQILQKKHDGVIPRDMVLLQSLPGIGQYTSAAIAAFAHDEKVPAIDTNVEKIIQVVFPEAEIPKKAAELVAFSSGGRIFNGAMMDVAAFIRQNRRPPDSLKDFMEEKELKKVFFKKKKKPKIEDKPQNQKKSKKKKKYVMEVGVACIHKDGKYLVQTRPDDKSFSGQWEFPGGKKERGESMRACVKREIMEELGCVVSVRPAFVVVKHEFDNIFLHLHFHRCQIQAKEPIPQEGQMIKWVTTGEFDAVGFLETNNVALEKLKKMRV